MDVVTKIAKTPTGSGGPFQRDVPRQPVVIESDEHRRREIGRAAGVPRALHLRPAPQRGAAGGERALLRASRGHGARRRRAVHPGRLLRVLDRRRRPRRAVQRASIAGLLREPDARRRARSTSCTATATSCIGERFCAATGATLLDGPDRGRARRRRRPCSCTATRCAPTTSTTRPGAAPRARAPGSGEFLAKPLAERRTAIGGMREKSKEVIAGQARRDHGRERRARCARRMQRHGVQRLIHGHTHRPGRHARRRSTGGAASAGCCPTGTAAAATCPLPGNKPRLVQF